MKKWFKENYLPLSICMLIIILFSILYLFGSSTYYDDNLVTEIYAGYFDYSENNTIYFKDRTGFQEIHFKDGTTWQGQIDDNSWIPYFKADGYNFSLLNQSAKCVTVYVKSWRDNYEWHDELDKVILSFYNKSPKVYNAENLELG